MSTYPASVDRSQRTDHRRYTGDPQTDYGSLRPEDSLVARIESVWKMRKTVVQIEFGDLDGDTGVYAPTIRHFSRKEAAGMLRALRQTGAYMHRTDVGWYVEVA